MRILWIGADTTDGNSGVEIFDRNLITALRSLRATVTSLSPKPVPRLAKLGNYLAGRPHYRASYASAANVRRLHEAARSHDVAVCSWEPFDWLATRLPIPALPILHNITSQSLAASNPESAAAAFLARRAALWERSAYGDGGPFRTIAVLGRKDEQRVRAYRTAPILYLPPGMPAGTALSPTRGLSPDLVISGSYGWGAKRRDLICFAREYSASRHHPRIHADAMPEEARTRLTPTPLDFSGGAIRIGLIADRFSAGFKLKSTFYIANNCVVLSYADIMADFRAIPDAPFFIRRIRHARDIDAHIDELATMPRAVLIERMQAFKRACSEAFDWQCNAATLLSALQEIRSSR